MTEAPANNQGPARGPNLVFAEATRLFNHWLETLDTMMASRSKDAGDAAKPATAALIAHLNAHPSDAALDPVRARLTIVFQRLRHEEAGKPG